MKFRWLLGVLSVGINLSHLVPILSGDEITVPKLLVIGAHPDDPETGAGGLITAWTQAGRSVTVTYLTTGEAGIAGETYDAAALNRRKEALEACALLGAKPVFLGQIDGDTVVDHDHVKTLVDLLESEQPDLLLTHWPIDTHLDHQTCAILVYTAWMRGGYRQPLYYYEVMSGVQSQLFHPTDYVDISSVVQRKHEACFRHASQHIEAEYPASHGEMERFRGMEAGVTSAEAYVRHPRSPVAAISLQP